MKSTIREDNNRKVIKQEYLNDNALLEVTELDDSIKVSIRFVENDSVKEHALTTMTRSKYLQEGEERIVISEDGKKIALFRREGEDFWLERLYDLEEHSFTVADFMDIEYKKHFKSPVLSKSLSYKMEVKDA